MGLTKRKDGWYVEFPVVDDGEGINISQGHPWSQIETVEDPHLQQDPGRATRGQD